MLIRFWIYVIVLSAFSLNANEVCAQDGDPFEIPVDDGGGTSNGPTACVFWLTDVPRSCGFYFGEKPEEVRCKAICTNKIRCKPYQIENNPDWDAASWKSRATLTGEAGFEGTVKPKNCSVKRECFCYYEPLETVGECTSSTWTINESGNPPVPMKYDIWVRPAGSTSPTPCFGP